LPGGKPGRGSADFWQQEAKDCSGRGQAHRSRETTGAFRIAICALVQSKTLHPPPSACDLWRLAFPAGLARVACACWWDCWSRLSILEGDLAPASYVQISIAIPPTLKQQLVLDHDTIKKGSKLLPLPRSPCVEEVLSAYITSMQQKGRSDSDAEQVAFGLRAYFDRSLALVRSLPLLLQLLCTECNLNSSVQAALVLATAWQEIIFCSAPNQTVADTSLAVQLLLYAEERMQSDQFIADGTLPSTVYGAEHLLRLFVKLPEYLPIAGSTEQQYRLLQDKLHEVLDFLQSKSAEFFIPQNEYMST
jgi:MRG